MKQDPSISTSLLKRLSGLFLGLFILVSLFSLPIIAYAQTSGPPLQSPQIEMTAEPLFEGNFKYGEWLPVVVDLSNYGSDINADLRISVLSTGGTVVYSTPSELPAGAKKRLTLYVLPNNFSRQLDVELVSGQELLVKQRVQVSPNPTVNFLVGILASDRGAISIIQSIEIPGMPRPKVLIDIPLDQMPERSEGLRSFDALVLNDIDTSQMSSAQLSALESWVQAGGILVVGGGANAQLASAGLSTTLIPGEILDTVQMDSLTSLEGIAGPEKPIRIPGPFIAGRLSSEQGRLLIGDQDSTLVHEWNLGTGAVIFSALDLAVSPFDSWNGTQSFWEKLLSNRAAFPSWMPVDIGARQQFASNMPYALQNLPMLDLPSVRGLAVMLIIYILSVGPINYYVLKRAKRLQWAWISIPAITLLFSALTLGFGIALHGNDIFINKITFLQLEPSGDAKFSAFVGVFSPAQTSYQVELSGGGLISPLSPYYEPWMSSVDPNTVFASGNSLTMVQSEPAVVKGLSVDQWSMQSFMSEGKVTGLGQIESGLILADDTLSGTLTNQTSSALIDSYLILGQKYLHLGALPVGGSFEVSLDLSTLGSPLLNTSLSYTMFEKEINQSGLSSDRRVWESRRAIIESIFERTPPYFKFSSSNSVQNSLNSVPVFVAWIENATPEVRIVGSESAEQASTIIVAPLSYVPPEEGVHSIPVGMIPGQLSKSPPEGGYCGMPGTLGVYMPNGEALFDFSIPELDATFQPETLRFGIWTDNGAVFIVPNIDFFDWEASDWVPLSGIQQGIVRLPSANKFIDREGHIQVRLSVSGGQGCYFLALGAEGSNP